MKKDREIVALVGFNKLPISKDVVEVLESEGFGWSEIEQAIRYFHKALNEPLKKRYNCGKCVTRLMVLVLRDLDGKPLQREEDKWLMKVTEETIYYRQ